MEFPILTTQFFWSCTRISSIGSSGLVLSLLPITAGFSSLPGIPVPVFILTKTTEAPITTTLSAEPGA